MIGIRGTTVVAVALALTLAGPAGAQDGQVSAEAPIAPPTDAQGFAPQAKITASWPLLEVANPSYVGVPAVGTQSRAVKNPPTAGTGPVDTLATQPIVQANYRNPTKRISVPRPRPGQPVTLSSIGSTDVDGNITTYAWKVVRDAGLEVTTFESKDAEFTVPTAPNTTYLDVQLTITGLDGQTSTASTRVTVAPNVAPVVELRRHREIKQCTSKIDPTSPTGRTLTAGVVKIPTNVAIQGAVAALPLKKNQGVTMYANACDPDGQIVRYEYYHRDREPQLDGRPDIITDTLVSKSRLDSMVLAPTAQDQARGRVSFLVRVYDIEGGMSEAEYSTTVAPQCVKGPQKLGYFTITPRGACVEKAEGGEVLIDRRGGSFVVNGIEFTVGPNSDVNGHSGAIRYTLLNGGTPSVKPVAPGAVSPTGVVPVQLSGSDKPAKGVGVIELPTSGITTAVDASGARLDLPVTTKLEFDSDGFFKTQPKATDVKFSGLGLTKIENARIASTIGNGSLALFTAAITVQTPKEFGTDGSTTPENAYLFRAAGGATAGAAQNAAPIRLGPSELEIAGIAIKGAYMELRGADSWDVTGSFSLDTPLKIGKINASAGIQDGKFAYLDAEAVFGEPGIFIPPASLFIKSLRFVVDFGSGKPTPCVPNVGKETKRFDEVRKILTDLGYSGDQAYLMVPDLEFDYGVPAFQACGAVRFQTDPSVPLLDVPLAKGQVALGFADYTDRDDVFRVLGKPLNIVGVPAEVLFEVYEDGYINLDAEIRLLLQGKLSVRAGLNFEAKLPAFNAGAYAEVCVLVLDLGCASAQALLSSKGVGACFNFDFAFFEFSPGATYLFGGDFTPYLDGCDIGDVKVAIDGAGNVNVTKLPPGAPKSSSRAKAAQNQDTVFTPPTSAASTQPELVVPAGTTGAVFTVRGAEGKLPKFELVKPDGSVLVTVDDQPSPGKLLRPVQPGTPRVIKSPETGITSVLLTRPPVGTWKVRLAADSPTIVEASVGLGVPKPKVDYQLTRPDARGARTLTLDVADKRRGITTRVVEAGATGAQTIGSFRVGANQRTTRKMTFVPAATKAENRTITVFVERHGIPVFAKRLGGTPRPGTPFKGTFAAAGPRRLPSPGAVATRVRPGSVNASWRKVPGARSYVVLITTSDGRRLRYSTRATSLTKKIRTERHDAVKVQVRAVGRGNRGGAISTDRVAARGPAPTRPLSPAEKKGLARIR